MKKFFTTKQSFGVYLQKLCLHKLFLLASCVPVACLGGKVLKSMTQPLMQCNLFLISIWNVLLCTIIGKMCQVPSVNLLFKIHHHGVRLAKGTLEIFVSKAQNAQILKIFKTYSSLLVLRFVFTTVLLLWYGIATIHSRCCSQGKVLLSAT